MSFIVTAAAAFHMFSIVLALLFIYRRVFNVPVSHTFLVILAFPDACASLVPSLRCTGHPNYTVLHLLDRLQFLSEAPIEFFHSYRFSHGLLGLGDGILEKDAWPHVSAEADALLGRLLLIE
jgi:hypothetical protein